MFNLIAKLLVKFNEVNDTVKINNLELYSKPEENGATCALHFIETRHGQENHFKYEFKDEIQLLKYLNYHTKG